MTSKSFLYRVWSDKRGATAIEYGLIASLIVVACIAAFDSVANQNTGLWAVVSNKVNTSISNS